MFLVKFVLVISKNLHERNVVKVSFQFGDHLINISLVMFEFYSTNNSKNIDNSDTTSELSQSAKMCSITLPSRHLFVLSQQWKHQNKV